MQELYFIRHGESVLNVAKKWAGTTDAPLTDKGHQQAKQAGRAAKKQGLRFDLILSSPLERARHTAEHVATQIGYPVADIQFLPDLIERSFGVLEGDYDLVARTKYFVDESAIDDYEGVEKLVDLQKRTDEVLAYVRDLPYNRILIVGHGAAGRALRRAINQKPLRERGESYENAQIVRLI